MPRGTNLPRVSLTAQLWPQRHSLPKFTGKPHFSPAQILSPCRKACEAAMWN